MAKAVSGSSTGPFMSGGSGNSSFFILQLFYCEWEEVPAVIFLGATLFCCECGEWQQLWLLSGSGKNCQHVIS